MARPWIGSKHDGKLMAAIKGVKQPSPIKDSRKKKSVDVEKYSKSRVFEAAFCLLALVPFLSLSLFLMHAGPGAGGGYASQVPDQAVTTPGPFSTAATAAQVGRCVIGNQADGLRQGATTWYFLIAMPMPFTS